MRATKLGLVLIAAFACSKSGTGSPARHDAVQIGDGTATISFQNEALVLSRGATTLLTFSADGLALGVVDALDDTVDYDPFPDGTPPSSPEGLRWVSVTAAQLVSSSATAFEMILTYDEGKTAHLAAALTSTESFALTLTPSPDGPPVALFRLRANVDAAEGFYGLGEYFDDVNNRGHVRAMQLEANGGETESGYNEAHVPIPFVIGTRGWGLFVASRYPAVFDVAKTAPDRLTATFGTGAASAAGLEVHVFSAARPLDVTKRYYDVTVAPALPAPWALGPLLWRNENKDQAQVEADLNAMRDLDLPHTAFWLDRPYATEVNTFDFDPAKFNDAPAMLQKAHDLGFRVGLWHTPYLNETSPKTAALFQEASSNGYYPPVTSLALNSWGRPLDFTNPAAQTFWEEHLRIYADAGIEGYKLDFAEDIAPTVGRGRNVWKFSDGSDERTMHALYTHLYHQTYAATLQAAGGFLICRAGTWGDQGTATEIWPGDLDSSFDVNGQKEDSYTAVGGLPASIIAGLSLGPSGFPFFGADTGGYRHGPPDKELFVRWFEQTALSSVMQIGNGSSTVAWEKDAASGFDDEMLGFYRTYTRLHLRLFPYEWTLAQRLAADGRPITRPLGLAYPELGAHPNDEYLFGDDLLVAPVTTRGATSRSVLFPPGEWLDWWTGAVHAGGQTETVSAPLGILPLFLRRGGVVPLLRPTIDAIAATTAPDRVDSFATTAGILYPRLGGGADGQMTLFDGTSISQTSSAKETAVHVSGGSSFQTGMVLEVVGTAQAVSATLDGTPLAAAASLEALEALPSGIFPTATGAFVKVPGGDHAAAIQLP